LKKERFREGKTIGRKAQPAAELTGIGGIWFGKGVVGVVGIQFFVGIMNVLKYT